MISRQNLVDLFATFIQFADDRFSGWVADPRLRRSMQRCMADAPEIQPPAAEPFWVAYWHQAWQAEQSTPQTARALGLGHLSAYLQETAYWVAQRATTQTLLMQQRLSDCFQIAIATLPQILQHYQPERGASLKTYAQLYFSNAIRDTLRQQREAELRTDWGLLRKISQKQLMETLQAAGLSVGTITSYRLAWTGFKLFCAPDKNPTTRQLQAPDPATWAAIAQWYNQQQPQQEQALPAATAEHIEKWLKICAKQIRSYLNPAIASLNVPKGEGEGDWQEALPDATGGSPLTQLIAQEDWQERQAQRSQVSEVLAIALTQLDPSLQEVLTAYYRDGLTQQHIAQQLNTKQYTVSRRLSSAKKALLEKLAQWSEATLHISLTSPALNDMGLAIEEWLHHHYQRLAPVPDSGT